MLTLSDDDLIGDPPSKSSVPPVLIRPSKELLDQGYTLKETRFIYHIVAGATPTEAALAAGYSPTVAGSQILKRPHIQAAINAELTDDYRDSVRSSLAQVVSELSKIAFSDPKAFVTRDGRTRGIHELDDMSAAAVAAFETATDDVGGNITTRTTKVKLHDKKAALDSLAKIYGVADKLEVTGKGGGPMVTATMTAEEAYRAMLGKP